MKKIFLALGLIISAERAIAATVTASLSGGYVGVATQDYPRTSFNVRIDIHNGGGRIDYPSLNCGGQLTYVGQTGEYGQIFHYRESITYGRDKCLDGGSVEIRKLSEDNVSWRWAGSGVNASASLLNVSRLNEQRPVTPAPASPPALASTVPRQPPVARQTTPRSEGSKQPLSHIPGEDLSDIDLKCLTARSETTGRAATGKCVEEASMPGQPMNIYCVKWDEGSLRTNEYHVNSCSRTISFDYKCGTFSGGVFFNGYTLKPGESKPMKFNSMCSLVYPN